ncbi:hypothetical protein O6H91_07G077800 [Diphasiastrum complanatum]|uniref:Uncharacterized protein n=1 Tax=Diphasiastrum complanatum TaxID=34168 RepID=A0ACC2D710_DIPCM|nr:hypothetical protein O6H91_07G077800 [Diphasiastrum complanatum]
MVRWSETLGRACRLQGSMPEISASNRKSFVSQSVQLHSFEGGVCNPHTLAALSNMRSSAELPSFKLNSGTSMPAIGLGFANADNSPDSKAIAAVLHAIEVGYRHFDTASIYGTECALGDALSKALSAGMVSRQDLFITSKLWSDSHDPKDVIPALQQTLTNLKLDYLDLYLIHSPMKLKKGAIYPPKAEEVLPSDIEGAWSGMETCFERGLAKAIGVSNFLVKDLAQLLAHARVPPAVNQVEMHPVWQQKKLRKFCNGVGIHVSAWSPLGAPGTYYGINDVFTNPVIKSISSKHNKSPTQVALRWSFQLGASVLPKSFTFSRIIENFNISDWELSPEDMTNIGNIKRRPLSILEQYYIEHGTPFKTMDDSEDEDP